jgi:hypothetical protein
MIVPLIVVLGLSGAGFLILISISNARHKRRLQEMKMESDLKRENYSVVSDKILP